MSMDVPQSYCRAPGLLLSELFANGHSRGRKPKQQADNRGDNSGKYTQRGSRASPAGKKKIRREGGVAAASG